MILARPDINRAGSIVLDARGSGLFKRLLLGSTASRWLRKSRHPVLVVKQIAHVPYQSVVAAAAADFSPAYATAVRTARAIAPSADLQLLHVFDAPFEGKLRNAGIGDDIIKRYRDEAHARALQQSRDQAADAGCLAPSTRLSQREAARHGRSFPIKKNTTAISSPSASTVHRLPRNF